MLALVAGLALTPAAGAATGGYPYASYNAPGSNPALSIWLDPLGNPSSPYSYVYRSCTDFVAWKLSTTNGIEDVRGYGNANLWVAGAGARGYRVDAQPTVGAVAWWSRGPYGHVAWVAGITGRGVRLQEYNYAAPGKYDKRTIKQGDAEAYIHFADLVASGDQKGNRRSRSVGAPAS